MRFCTEVIYILLNEQLLKMDWVLSVSTYLFSTHDVCWGRGGDKHYCNACTGLRAQYHRDKDAQVAMWILKRENSSLLHSPWLCFQYLSRHSRILLLLAPWLTVFIAHKMHCQSGQSLNNLRIHLNVCDCLRLGQRLLNECFASSVLEHRLLDARLTHNKSTKVITC